jgi:tetratricopeptide (TPR) repeat protein
MLPRIRAGYRTGPQPLARRRRARCEFFQCLAFVAGFFLPATAVPSNSGCVRDAQFRELLTQEMNLPIGVRANAYEETPRRFPGLKDFNTLRPAAGPRLPRGDAYPSQHDLTLAREEYGRAYQFDRTLPTLNLRAGFLNFRQGNYAPARQQFQREITPEPHARHPARREGEGSTTAKAEVPSWPSVQAEASLAARASLRRMGTFASPQVQQLSRCTERSNRRCVSNALNAIHDHSLQHDPDYLNLKAQALNLLQQGAKALAAIQQAIRLRPNQEEYYITEGRIDQGLDNQKAAIQAFLYAERLRPDAAGPFYDIGMSFFLLGNAQNDSHYYDWAGKHFKVALQLDPKDDRARFMLGVVAVSKFDLNEAHEDFEQALRLNPRNAYYHLYLGVLLGRMGNRSAAVRELLAAERLDPSNARAYFNLGALYAQAGRDQAARRQLERAVQLDPKFAPAFYSLGLVYRNLRLPAKAHESFQRFQQLKSRQQQ